MGLIKSAGDLVYTFRFLKLLVTKFEESDAYKAGIIDADGNKIKDFNMSTQANRDAYSSSYTPFIRLVFNIKKIMAKAPGGGSKIASYAAALYLLKERYGISDSKIEQSIKEVGLDPTDFMVEQTQWFVLEDGRLSPGTYKLVNDKMVNSTFEEAAKAKETVRVGLDAYPIGDLFGLNIYEATHVKTNQQVYITIGELSI
jgi:hypothetical protein